MEAQAVIALVIGIVVVLLPALVWSTVIVGLYQTVRAKMQESVKMIARKVTVGAK